MKANILLILRLTLAFAGLFICDRIFHIIVFSSSLESISLGKFLTIFYHAWRLDLSTIGYIMALPILLLVVSISSQAMHTFYKAFLSFYIAAIIIIINLISWINMNLMKGWGEKISWKAIKIFLQFPYESFISSQSYLVYTTGIGYIFWTIIYIHFSKKWILKKEFVIFPQRNWKLIPFYLFLILIDITSIRGGWQLSPINSSMSYFSNVPLENQLTANSHWELVQDILHDDSQTDANFRYFDEVKDPYEKLENQKQSNDSAFVSPLSTAKTNVVLIILESFTADIIEPLGGEKDVTPFFTSLTKEGTLFTNFYASGDRTDKGLIAILSGFPSQAVHSIINEPKKEIHLPSLFQDFKSLNYHTSFYYGGESEFFGIKSYLMNHQVDQLTDLHQFPDDLARSKWGIFDEFVFDRQLNDLKNIQKPFFSTILSLSNHEPFEIPIQSKFKEKTESNLFRNTAYYTDKCLKKYFEQAKKQDWYANTIFILVADHGHRLPKDSYPIHDYHRFRIPFVMVGEPLKKEFRGKRVEQFASQTDIRPSLNTFFGRSLKPSQVWSKNILFQSNENPIFYSWDGGFAIKSSTVDYAFDFKSKKDIRFQSTENQEKEQAYKDFAKAYMQKIIQDYEAMSLPNSLLF